MTTRIHRLVVFITALRQVDFNTWWSQNIDTEGAGHRTFTVPLNGSGDNTPPTHYWCSTSLTSQQLRRVLARLCNLANIEFPVNWNALTRTEQLQWLATQRPAIRAAIGVWIVRSDNDGIWEDPEQALATMAVKRQHQMTLVEVG